MGARILVVDDCKDTVDIVSMLLSLLGHVCRGAPTGRAALDEATGFRPQIVLLDLALPDMSGFEVARALRARSEDPMFVAALTGSCTPRDRERTRHYGFDQHLVKPIGRAALCSVLQAAGL